MLDFNTLNGYQKATYVFQHLQAFVSLLGVIGNLLIICVFCRRSLRKYSYSFYSKAMAVSDIIVVSHSFRHWARFMFDADIDLVAPFLCSINEYQPYVTVGLSLWILFLISIDRLVTIVYPNRFKLLKQRWCQALLVVAVTIINMAIFIEMPLNYSIVSIPDPATNTTGWACVPTPEIGKISSWLLLINLFLMAIVINNCLNLKMLVYLVKSRRKVSMSMGGGGGGGAKGGNSAARDRKFAISTIGLNLCSFVLKLPICVGLLAANYLDIDPLIIQMIFTINVMLATTDNCVSFVINMTLNSVFYDEFMAMLGINRLRSILASTSGGGGNSSRRLTLASTNTRRSTRHQSLRA